jgi:hypothetical protein
MRLRDRLVAIALEWQDKYGVAPHITGALSELDAATVLLGMSEEEYARDLSNATAVRRGYDFVFNGLRYQVKANRPSGKPGSFVTLTAKARNYEWDRLIWILYSREYQIEEAWMWEVDAYRSAFDMIGRLSPKQMRGGLSILVKPVE